ncbi:major histocompatibility complex class I-related gene protein-like [Engraulis encrasicolus]|uniref:major histocompatibility complex class I-related gene protein-like n=1 Tax=Engraulis encrasicolus TaxID=184585 RepID=UPI002FD6EE5B
MDTGRTLVLFLLVLKANGGSHSLLMLATFIIGDTPFPEFSAVVMLDDVQLLYYDSSVKTALQRELKWAEDGVLKMDASIVFGNVNRGMEFRAHHLKRKLNHTSSLHVQQRLSGCELLDHDQPGPMFVHDAFNGESGDHLSANKDQYSFRSQWHWPAMWDILVADQVKWLHKSLYHPICLRTLRTYLHRHKNHLLRKVKPRVRLLQKRLPDSGEVRVTCLATGFYPRHINLTLLRDGQPVPDHQITGGELLPNGDETYQMRKSLEVSTEELQRHHYKCTAQHLSLDNKLDIHLDLDGSLDPASATPLWVLISIALILMFAVTAPVAVAIKCYRRHQGQPNVYALAPTTLAQKTAPDTPPED